MAQTRRDEKLELLTQILKTKINFKLFFDSNQYVLRVLRGRVTDSRFIHGLEWIKNSNDDYELVLGNSENLHCIDNHCAESFPLLLLACTVFSRDKKEHSHITCKKEISHEILNQIINPTLSFEKEKKLIFDWIEANNKDDDLFSSLTFCDQFLKKYPNDARALYSRGFTILCLYAAGVVRPYFLQQMISDFIITIIGYNSFDNDTLTKRNGAMNVLDHVVSEYYEKCSVTDKKSILQYVFSQLPEHRFFSIKIRKEIDAALSNENSFDDVFVEIKNILWSHHIEQDPPCEEYVELNEKEWKIYCKKNNTHTFFPSLKGYDVEDQKGYVTDVENARTNLGLHNAL